MPALEARVAAEVLDTYSLGPQNPRYCPVARSYAQWFYSKCRYAPLQSRATSPCWLFKSHGLFDTFGIKVDAQHPSKLEFGGLCVDIDCNSIYQDYIEALEPRFQKIVLFAPRKRANIVKCVAPVNDDKLVGEEESAEEAGEGKQEEIVITIDDEPCE